MGKSVQASVVPGSPVSGHHQLGSAIQHAAVAVPALPPVRRFDQLLLYLQASSIFVDPIPQSWPRTEQDFVGDLDGFLLLRQQTGTGEFVEYSIHALLV
ncbi:hypothetical protein BU204_27155 [Actinophytocola xanthii]|uniref:Uncharacterized protein n=1 Tax=Actinophytocola xanthii TaxID=1912961 RepID=A0A1Q8CGI0_9PSEU|nr:hypothetical protein BU204_27155 [Actinophytocola xanthii]